MTTKTITLEAKATTKSLIAGGFLPLKEVAARARMHAVTAKKQLEKDGQSPTKLGRRCFYRLEQLDGLLTHRAYVELSVSRVEQENDMSNLAEPPAVSFDANGSEPTE